MEKQKQSRRLLSLDALRGFDMFFIMGGASLFVALATLFPNSFFQAIGGQMDHVEWDGLTHHDTIFPLFLFIAGISFPFSLEKQREQGKSESDIYKRIVRRGITLVLLGCVYNGLLQFDFANLRCASVLARIGLGWMFAALLFVHFRTSVRAWIAGTILVGYWVWIAFIPVPGAEAGPFTLEGNWVGYVDRLLLPGRLHQGFFDPEGLLSTLPGIVTAMLGMFTGEFIKLRKEGGRTSGRWQAWCWPVCCYYWWGCCGVWCSRSTKSCGAVRLSALSEPIRFGCSPCFITLSMCWDGGNGLSSSR